MMLCDGGENVLRHSVLSFWVCGILRMDAQENVFGR